MLLLGLVALAGSDALSGAITVGAFAMIFFLANQIIRSVQELSYRMLDYFEQLGTLAEALELVSQRARDRRCAGREAARRARRRDPLREHQVRPSRRAPGVRRSQSHIRAGEKVGLVGPSGAGKSTLVKLLRRQFEPQAGRILIDGQDIAHVTWDSLNEAIAEVPQVAGVFHRAVRDNIRYAKPDADEGEVAARGVEAYAHEFITGRATGYDTIVGEQGIKLSGGERQRVAIARALVKDARILVLDEATSSLDSESEHLIQEALWTLMQGRTVIAIAHRLSTIAGMDRIVYLEAGASSKRATTASCSPRAAPMRGSGTARWAASSTRLEVELSGLRAARGTATNARNLPSHHRSSLCLAARLRSSAAARSAARSRI